MRVHVYIHVRVHVHVRLPAGTIEIHVHVGLKPAGLFKMNQNIGFNGQLLNGLNGLASLCYG